jgi:hypothetical protein
MLVVAIENTACWMLDLGMIVRIREVHCNGNEGHLLFIPVSRASWWEQGSQHRCRAKHVLKVGI